MNELLYSKNWENEKKTYHYSNFGKCLCNGHFPNKRNIITNDLSKITCINCENILIDQRPAISQTEG